MSVKIYSVEDDKDIAAIINKTLTHQGYEVFTFYDGKGLKEAMKNIPDIILLDIMLPDISGIDILKELRFNHIYDDVRIIMVSAKNMLIDKVDALDMGADDYIEKPFDLELLLVKIKAMLRRTYEYRYLEREYLDKDTYYDVISGRFIYQNQGLDLTKSEAKIMSTLIQQRGNWVTREQLMMVLWNTDEFITDATLSVHISRLRNKLNELTKGKDIIKTKKGVGYYID